MLLVRGNYFQRIEIYEDWLFNAYKVAWMNG